MRGSCLDRGARRLARARALAFAVCATACATTIDRPYVPALRYAAGPMDRPPAEGELPQSPPDLTDVQTPTPRLPIASFVLDGGVHVLVVERHGYPTVAGRIVIHASSAFAGDTGAHRAEILRRVFLSPHGSGDFDAKCGPDGCAVATRGLSSELGSVLERLAGPFTHAPEDPKVYDQRFRTAEDWIVGSMYDPRRSFRRSSAAIAFGDTHRYGDSSDGTRPTWADIDTLRRKSFLPGAATLVVVGDVDRGAVEAEATRRLARWRGEAPPDDLSDPPPPKPSPTRIVAFHAGTRQLLGGIVARGPAPSDPDAVAYRVLVELLGGTAGSMAYRQARDDMGASYTIGASVQWHRGGSMMVLGGSFDRDSAVDGLKRLLDGISRACAVEPAAEALDRAKREAVAAWRQSMSSNDGIAAMLGDAIMNGVAPESTQDIPARIDAVTAADVHAEARSRLARSKLRVVFSGDPEFLVNADVLGFGWPAKVDGFGSPTP